MIVLILIEAVAGAMSSGDLQAAMSNPAMIVVMTVLIGAYLVLAFLDQPAIQIKRWHDRDKSVCGC